MASEDDDSDVSRLDRLKHHPPETETASKGRTRLAEPTWDLEGWLYGPERASGEETSFQGSRENTAAGRPLEAVPVWFEGMRAFRVTNLVTLLTPAQKAGTDARTSLSLGNSSPPVRLIPEVERVRKSCCEPAVW